MDPEDEDSGIGLEEGLHFLRDAECHFNLGRHQEADSLLGHVQGMLEYFEGPLAAGDMTPKSSAEVKTLRRALDAVNARLSPQRKYVDAHNRPPSDFLELFRTNTNNTMWPEAIANGLRRIRMVAVDNGERARQVMIGLRDMPTLPPPGWTPQGEWGFEYWPTDFASAFDPSTDDIRALVAGRLEAQPPPIHIHIDGALVWVDDERFFVRFTLGPWHPGACPDEVVPL